jgi:hypothetical protein
MRRDETQITETTTIPTSMPPVPSNPSNARPNFDPEAVLTAMNARAAAVRDARAKYEAAAGVSQAILDFEIRV